MIGLSSLLFDPDGALRIEESPDSELSELRRRVSRVRTLDGGVAVNDTGYSAGDRDLVVRWQIRNAGDYGAAQRLVRVWPRLLVTLREGAFVVAPDSVRARGKIGEIRLLVLEQVA
jgi:hypothetical protein